MENNYMIVMLWSLSVTWFSHYAFFISGAKSKNNLRAYMAFSGNTIQKYFFFNIMILSYWWFVLFFHINFSDIYIFNLARCEKSK